ncbi:MAG: GNAT family N-acetyltransferase [Proteobacteria bacterium]|nr:GNAT family N-acetyltransferase [Pseudomonadota bacterium]MCP4922291.1 GNAT family N-acetyltransferase [Pseudomonadota bacterium]
MRRRIDTERLTLRSWEDGDGPALRAALDRSDAHLRPWVPFMRNEPRSLQATCDQVVEFARQFAAGEVYRWAVLAGDVLVGEALFMQKADAVPAIGYWLHVDHCGRGYAGEAIRALLAEADAQEVAALEAFVDVANDGSNGLIARLGFELDRTVDMEGDRLHVWLRCRPEVG